MKKQYSDQEKLEYYRKRTKALEEALELAYEDILYVMNIGKFKEDLNWNPEYILKLLPKLTR